LGFCSKLIIIYAAAKLGGIEGEIVTPGIKCSRVEITNMLPKTVKDIKFYRLSGGKLKGNIGSRVEWVGIVIV